MLISNIVVNKDICFLLSTYVLYILKHMETVDLIKMRNRNVNLFTFRGNYLCFSSTSNSYPSNLLREAAARFGLQ